MYFDLSMLDEAVEQLEKVEVRAPDLPVIHAFLGAVFERRGQTSEALDEYRRALRSLELRVAPPVHGVRGRACGLGGPLPVMPSLEHPPALAPPRPAVRAWRQWLTAAVDLVFPPFCSVCAARLGPGRRDPLCGACWNGLERIAPPCCRLCGLPFEVFAAAEVTPEAAAPAGSLCGACRRRRPPWAYARAAARYGDCAREALHAFKFGGRRALAVPLGDLLAELGPALPLAAVDVVVPVPLHPRRERERGFNQSWLLARAPGRRVGAHRAAPTCSRGASPPPPRPSSARPRAGSMCATPSASGGPSCVAGRHVLLVDDILTTGATAAECVRRAAEWGRAATVGVVTVARA